MQEILQMLTERYKRSAHKTYEMDRKKTAQRLSVILKLFETTQNGV